MHPRITDHLLSTFHNKAKTAAIVLCHRRQPTRNRLYPNRKGACENEAPGIIDA